MVAEMDDGVVYDLSISGTKPSSGDLPIRVTNSDGEILSIEEGSGGTLIYSGFFYADVDPSAAGSCTHCVCSILDPICIQSPGSYNDCDVDGSTCYQWGCGTGGGSSHYQIEPNFYAEI